MRNIMISRYFGAFVISAYLSSGNALECYVCTNQEGNANKCLQTISQCEYGQDVCMTEVRWGSAPYWTRGGPKQSYVTKSCATKKECEKTKRNNMKHCTYLWYTDYTCSECCIGDRCNYFIISSGNKQTISLFVLVAVLTSLFGAWRMQ